MQASRFGGFTRGVQIAFAILLGTVAQAGAGVQNAAFTYQGVLKQSGTAMNASVDLEFRLFDDPTAGTQVGATVPIGGVAVANGVFSVSLDFGSLAYDGNERWLSISVASPAAAGAGPFTTLAPRQKLASAPFAAFALGVNGAAVTGINAANVATGTLADARLTANVGLLSSTQTFTGAKSFAVAPSFTAAGAPFTVSSATVVTNLNADRLDGLSSASFMPVSPNSITLSKSNPGSHTISGDNTSATLDSTGVYGVASSTTGNVTGVAGETKSTSGRGVYGTASAATGTTFGVWGETHSTAGRGVIGAALATTGSTIAGKFENHSTTGLAVAGTAYAVTGLNTGVLGESLSTSGNGVFGRALATSGTAVGGMFETNSTIGVGVWSISKATTGVNWGVIGESNTGTGVLGKANANTGDNFGVMGSSDSTSGVGVFGWAVATSGACDGGHFESDSTSGHAVFGIATTTTGSNYGGRFQTPSVSGRGVLGHATATTGDTHGVQGQCASNSGIGVYGVNTATSGDTFGVLGEARSADGYGVYGMNTASTGAAIGVFGIAVSPSGFGVYGESQDNVAVFGFASNTTGTNEGGRFVTASTTGKGVFGICTPAGGAGYGVYGQASTTLNGIAVFANGDMGASGVKPFRIDHPDDPTNKYLLHYAAESPDVINFYSGKVTLNGAGEAIVQLPPYFAKINRDPRYTLTAIGAAMPNLHVADEINEASLIAGTQSEPGEVADPCWFRIAGGSPGMRVSWEVKALRSDRRVQQHGAPVVVEKPEGERGLYQQPELYGQPAHLGMSHVELPTTKRPEAVGEVDAAANRRPSRGPARSDE